MGNISINVAYFIYFNMIDFILLLFNIYVIFLCLFLCFSVGLLKSVATEMKHRSHLYGIEDETEAQRKAKHTVKTYD